MSPKRSLWSKAHPDAKGDDAVKQVSSQPWDPSVQSLVAFPQVLAALGQEAAWVQHMGDAFLAQPDDVMDAVQHLRHKAQAAGQPEVEPVPERELQPARPCQPAAVSGGRADSRIAPATSQQRPSSSSRPAGNRVRAQLRPEHGLWRVGVSVYPPTYYPPPRNITRGRRAPHRHDLRRRPGRHRLAVGRVDWNNNNTNIDVDQLQQHQHQPPDQRQPEHLEPQHPQPPRRALPRQGANREGSSIGAPGGADGAARREQYRGDDAQRRTQAREQARSVDGTPRRRQPRRPATARHAIGAQAANRDQQRQRADDSPTETVQQADRSRQQADRAISADRSRQQADRAQADRSRQQARAATARRPASGNSRPAATASAGSRNPAPAVAEQHPGARAGTPAAVSRQAPRNDAFQGAQPGRSSRRQSAQRGSQSHASAQRRRFALVGGGGQQAQRSAPAPAASVRRR